jgi:Histidine kinase
MDAHRAGSPGRARLPGWGLDALVAVLAVGVLVAVSAHVPAASDRPLDALGYVLLVVAGVSMGLCRRWPAVAAGLVTVVLVVFVARRYPDGPVWVTGLIALAALSWRTSRRVALTGAAAMLAVLTVAAVLAGHSGLLLPLIYTGWAAAAVLGVDALRNRRDHLAGLRERALFAERTREEEARRRVAEERLRIARDLHDSVAHAMATINVQAGCAPPWREPPWPGSRSACGRTRHRCRRPSRAAGWGGRERDPAGAVHRHLAAAGRPGHLLRRAGDPADRPGVEVIPRTVRQRL